MSAPDFTLGQGDTGVVWQQAIHDKDGNPIDPTGGSVVAHYRDENATAPAVEVAGAIVPITNQPGQIKLTFAPAPVLGVYWIVWIVTLASGEIVTWPACAGRKHQTFEVVAKP